VVAPAAWRHYQAGAIVRPALLRLAPAAVGLIVIGVWVSDQFTGPGGAVWLGRLLAVFLAYVVVVNVRRLIAGRLETVGEARITWPRCMPVGGVMGFVAGLLGIGGGTVTVPLFQRVCHLPLRHCIGLSSAIMCITALFGAAMKNATLGQHEQAMMESFLIAACLAPTAFIGGLIGGRLTHVLPIMHVRIVFLVVLAVAAVRMLI